MNMDLMFVNVFVGGVLQYTNVLINGIYIQQQFFDMSFTKDWETDTASMTTKNHTLVLHSEKYNMTIEWKVANYRNDRNDFEKSVHTLINQILHGDITKDSANLLNINEEGLNNLKKFIETR